ncbi:MAG: hypothetical protein ABJ327_09380 [Litoreibacter sp.]
MFVGVSLSPWTWLMLIVGAAISLLLPFAIIGSIASYFRDPINTVVEVVLAGVGFPVFLGFLHSRKVFDRGLGSVFFKIYVWFYLLLGLFAIGFGYLAYDTPQYDGMIVGFVLLITAIGLIWWSRKTSNAYASAVESDADYRAEMEREEQIQIQAEAIVRAEQIKNSSE